MQWAASVIEGGQCVASNNETHRLDSVGIQQKREVFGEIHLAQGKLAVLKLEEVFLMQRQKNVNKVYLEEMEFPPAMIIVKDPILVQLRQRTVCFWSLLPLVYLN